MMPSTYISLDRREVGMDLDNVFEVVRGYSKKRPGWLCLIVYVPETRAFVELRDAPADVRGNSRDEAEEVTDGYLASGYGLTTKAIESIRLSPAEWNLMDLRR
jgi:hypothetical protein